MVKYQYNPLYFRGYNKIYLLKERGYAIMEENRIEYLEKPKEMTDEQKQAPETIGKKQVTITIIRLELRKRLPQSKRKRRQPVVLFPLWMSLKPNMMK
jgi:hypothetical protein